jgi:hypothetical protein
MVTLLRDHVFARRRRLIGAAALEEHTLPATRAGLQRGSSGRRRGGGLGGGLVLFHGVLPGHRLRPGDFHEANALSIAYDVPQAFCVVPEILRNP